MTEKEAIQQLEFDWEMILFDPLTGETIEPEMLKLFNEDNYKTYIADELAIKALEEIQQYWEIGTVAECREAVKAKRTVKPKFLHMLNDTRYRARCECGNIIIADIDVSNNPKYCSVCGKKLDWSEEDE